MPSLRPRLRVQESTRARLVEVRSTRLRLSQVSSLKPRFDYGTELEPDVVGVVPGVAGLMQWRSNFAVEPGVTTYLTPAGLDDDIDEAREPVPAGTAGRIVVEATAAPGIGQTFIYTLLKNGVATALTVTLTGAQTKGSSPATDVAFAQEDTSALELQTSAGAAQAKHKVTGKFTPT